MVAHVPAVRLPYTLTREEEPTMARSTQVAALAAAAAVVLGGLAWWLLGSGGATAPETPAPAVLPRPDGAEPKTAGPGPAARKAPHPEGSIRALVRGDGKPVAATLTASLAVDPAAEPARAEGSAADGSVVLECAPSGTRLRVVVASPGWRSAILTDVVVDAGAVKDLGTIDLERSLPATGRVLDPAGKPVAGATVGALVSEGAVRFDFRRIGDLLLNEPDWRAKATTGKDGTFLLDALGAGSWRLVATAGGFAPSDEIEVVLHPAGKAPPVDLVLQAGNSLLVKVTGPSDAPVAGLEVAAAAQGGRMGIPVVMGPSRGVTDAAGTVRLSGIPPGRTVVAVRSTDGRLVIRSADVPKTAEVAVRMDGTAALLVKVRDGGGAAMEGAAVTAMLDDGGRGLDSGQALTGTTGADGSVRWEHLSASRVMIVLAQKEGFPPPSPQGMFQPPGGGGPDQLKEGQTLEKEVVLKAGATVSGVVRRRPGETPVPGARVTLVAPGAFFGGQPKAATADAEGVFRMDGVPEGRMTLVASGDGLAAPGAWAAGMPAFGPPGREDPNGPEGSVDVPAGPAEVKKDLFVEATGSASGRVLSPSGEGLGGARIEVSQKRMMFPRGMFGDTGLVPAPVLSAPDGAFALKGVPAGQDLVVRASAPGFLDGTSSPFTLAAGGDSTALEVRLSEGGVVGGRVTGPGGTPVAGAKVRVSAQRSPGAMGGFGGFGGGPGRLEATTDAEGLWRVASVPPGTASISVQAQGFVDGVRSDLSVAAGTETRADLSLEPGRSISGVVRDTAGAPVEGARIMLRPAEGAPESRMWMPSMSATDGKGLFKVDGLAAGTFTVTVTAPGHPPATIPSVAAGTEGLEVRMIAAVRISGKVVDFEGNPVPNARVNAASEGGDQVSGNAATGADGTFTVENLAPGTYRVAVSPRDRRLAGVTAKGVAGDASDLLFTLPKALEIRGKVVGPDGGPPAERGFVNAMTGPSPRGPSMGATRWEQDGSFVLGGLTEGSYVLNATVPGKLAGKATATAGQTGVEIKLEAQPAPDGGGGNPTPVK
jgi:protocatechuate 3,4-dioxygenase beta subunit